MTPKALLDRLGLDYAEKSNRLQMVCPFHPDRNPSSGFYLDTEKFFCFACELSLDVVGFYAKYRETDRNTAARDLGVDPDPVVKFDRTKANYTRTKAERELKGRKGLPRITHSALGERLDRILWMYGEGDLNDDTLNEAMDRWYLDLETESGKLRGEVGPEPERAPADGTRSGVEEGTGNPTGSGPERAGPDLEGEQPQIPYRVPDVLD